jgi:hypothetical protein
MLDGRAANLPIIHITRLVYARALFDDWAYSVCLAGDSVAENMTGGYFVYVVDACSLALSIPPPPLPRRSASCKTPWMRGPLGWPPNVSPARKGWGSSQR